MKNVDSIICRKTSFNFMEKKGKKSDIYNYVGKSGLIQLEKIHPIYQVKSNLTRTDPIL